MLPDYHVQIRKTNIKNKNVDDDIKILVIGDMHISDIVTDKKIDIIINTIKNINPDYTVFVGDLIDSVKEIKNQNSTNKLTKVLKASIKISTTLVIMGNHDYINKPKKSSNKEDFCNLINSIDKNILLDNKIYRDDKILFMGYTETLDYYWGKDYNYKAFYKDLSNRSELYKNLPTNIPCITLTHSQEFTKYKYNSKLLKHYDLIICGHDHDGCIPFGIGKFKRGIISPKKTLFPANVRGMRTLWTGTKLLITGGITKLSNTSPKIFHPLNHLCFMQVDEIIITKDV